MKEGYRCCANCNNVGTSVCKECFVGNPPSKWEPLSKEHQEGDHDRRGAEAASKFRRGFVVSVFEKIKSMDKEELGEFIRLVYNIGWIHGAHGIDDELFYGVHLLEQDESVLEELE